MQHDPAHIYTHVPAQRGSGTHTDAEIYIHTDIHTDIYTYPYIITETQT